MVGPRGITDLDQGLEAGGIGGGAANRMVLAGIGNARASIDMARMKMMISEASCA